MLNKIWYFNVVYYIVQNYYKKCLNNIYFKIDYIVQKKKNIFCFYKTMEHL